MKTVNRAAAFQGVCACVSLSIASSSGASASILRLRLLRRWSTRAQEITQVFRRRETGVVVWSAIDDLPFLRHVFAPGAQRVLDRAHGSIEHSAHFLPFIAYELCDQLPALRRVRFSGGERASDPFGFGDVGDGGPLGQRFGDSGQAAFAAEFSRGFGLCFFGDWCLAFAHACQSARRDTACVIFRRARLNRALVNASSE
jgi:hypothetical protein